MPSLGLRFSSIALALSMLISFSVMAPTAYAAAPKVGEKCSKLNSKVSNSNKKLVCKKVAGKLVWKAVKAKPKKTESPTQQPGITPAKPLSAEIIYGQTSLDEISAKSKSVPEFTNYVLVVEPILKGTIWEKTQIEGIKQSFAMLSALGLEPKTKIYIFVSWTDDWLRSRLTEIGSECATLDAYAGGAYCWKVPTIFAHAGWFARNWGLSVNANEAPNEYMIGLVGNMPHEIAHAGQIFAHTKYGNSSGRLNPAWLREGWAEMFKVLYWAESRKVSFAEAHQLYLDQSAKNCAKHSILDLSSSGSHPNQEYCEYTNGYFATLKLLEVVKNVDLQFRLPGAIATSQADAFRQTFGLDYAEFAKVADEFVRRSLDELP